LFWHF